MLVILYNLQIPGGEISSVISDNILVSFICWLITLPPSLPLPLSLSLPDFFRVAKGTFFKCVGLTKILKKNVNYNKNSLFMLL